MSVIIVAVGCTTGCRHYIDTDRRGRWSIERDTGCCRTTTYGGDSYKISASGLIIDIGIGTACRPLVSIIGSTSGRYTCRTTIAIVGASGLGAISSSRKVNDINGMRIGTTTTSGVNGMRDSKRIAATL